MYSPYATPRNKRRTAGTPSRLAIAPATTEHDLQRAGHSVGRSPSATPSAFSRGGPASPALRLRYAGSEAPTVTAASAYEYTDDGELGGNPRRAPVFLSDKSSRVLSAGELPAEAQEDLRSGDHMYVHPVSAEVDGVSGYASVTTAQAVYVWNYRKTTFGRPSAYIFPYPLLAASSSIPLAHLVPHGSGSTTEPGLLLAFPDGALCFWPSVSVALTFRLGGRGVGGGSVKSAGGSGAGMGMRMMEGRVELGSEEGERDEIVRVDAVGPAQFLLVTAHATAHLLTLPSSASSANAPIPLVQLKIGSFLRQRTRLFSGSLRGPDQRWRVRAVCPGASGDEVWIGSATSVQRWSVARGQPKLLAEHSVDEILENGADDVRDLQDRQLMSLASTSSGALVALLSFAARSQVADHETLSYAVAVLDASANDNDGTGHTLELVRLIRLGYRAHLDHRLVPPPQVVLPSAAPVAFAQFSSAVVAVSLDVDRPYENVLTLKDSLNALIGTLHHSVRNQRRAGGSISRLLALTMTSGVLAFNVDLEPPSDGVSIDHSDDALLQRKLEQAVFFGAEAGNPLSFELQPGFKGDLARAALTLSEQVVSNGNAFCIKDVDIAEDLEWRSRKLLALIDFIRENGVLQDRACLRRLSTHAEMIVVAKALWQHLNADERMARAGQMKASALLVDGIVEFMKQADPTSTQDPVRDFFHYHLLDLETLLGHVHQKLVAQTARVRNDVQAVSEWQLEVNEIYELVYRNGLQRAHEDNVDIYGITREYSLPTETWLTSEQCLNQLADVYHRTTSVLAARIDTFGSSVNSTGDPSSTQQQTQQRLKQQLITLAGPLCFALEEQIRYLAFRSSVEGPAGDEEKMRKTDQYRQAIGDAVRALAGVDLKRAYMTADHHDHYGVLVELAASEQYGSAESIQKFVGSKGEPFTDALFSHYLDNGRYAALLDQPQQYEEYLSMFFEKHNTPRLAWLQNLRISHYDAAAGDLTAYAQQATVLQGKELSLSIGKLARLVATAQGAHTGPEGQPGDTHSAIERIDVDLHLTQVCAVLQKQIRHAARIGDRDTGEAANAKLESFTQTSCSKAHSRDSALILAACRQLAGTLVDGGVIDAEDVIDLITIMDNEGEDGIARLTRAFEVFLRDDVSRRHEYDIADQRAERISFQRIPTLRKQMLLLCMWRRVYLRDKWRTLSETGNMPDAEIKARVKQTAAAQLIQVLRSGQLNGFLVPPQYILAPEQTLFVPEPADLQQRYPTLAQGEAERMHAELVKEVEALQRLIDTTRLGAYVQHLLHD